MPIYSTIPNYLAALKLIEALFSAGRINAATYQNVLAQYHAAK
nr:MAG TPA: hypothetical protein [Inoviridae sp.]